jgi:hypothetical protein
MWNFHLNQRIDHIESLVFELKNLILGMTTKFSLQRKITQISELNKENKFEVCESSKGI